LKELLSHRKILMDSNQICVSCIPDARRSYEKALQLSREPLPNVHFGLTYVYYYQGQFGRSLEQADRYLELVRQDRHFEQFRNEVAVTGKFRSGYRPSPDTSFILEPAEMEDGRVYPVLIVLPFTGGTAADLLEHYLSTVAAHPCFVVIPPGAGSTADHSWEGFSASIERYEQHIEKGLDRLADSYGGRTGKRYLTGYSLGGDLSWALSIRNPDEYAGAIMMGTRCGYPAKAAALETLKRGGFRAIFASGRRELDERVEGMKKAADLFTEAGIENRFRQFPGGHVPADPKTFADALEYVFR
jgi:predicted esterase